VSLAGARPVRAEPLSAELRTTLVGRILDGTPAARRDALGRLLTDDREGTGLVAVVGTLAELEKRKDVAAQTDVARALGRPGLLAAVEPLKGFLDAKDAGLRAVAAVSLEYVGAPEAVGPLLARLDREKDDLVLAHELRALGRCGRGEERVRAALDRRATSGRTEALCCAAVIGLAYFSKDAATARILEEHLAKVGPPSFGRRSDRGVNSLKRIYLAWALAMVGNPKSGPFVRERLVKPLQNVVGGEIVAGVFAFYVAVAEVCEGRPDSMPGVEAGARVVSATYGNPLTAEARLERAFAGFTPLAEW
jgi:hypothetical protein